MANVSRTIEMTSLVLIAMYTWIVTFEQLSYCAKNLPVYLATCSDGVLALLLMRFGRSVFVSLKRFLIAQPLTVWQTLRFLVNVGYRQLCRWHE